MQELAYQIGEIGFKVQSFLDTGGGVLLIIAAVIVLMWALLIERALYFSLRFPQQARAVHHGWNLRPERQSWQAHQIREALIAGLRMNARSGVDTIKTLVAICPMLGLLGTVTGMIEVFDVMAGSGMGNPRLMAAGVSKATIPTMAGMVGALSGVFALALLDRTVNHRVEKLSDHLTIEITDEEVTA
jgi:biopolymer transport protein ExbB